MAGSSSGVVVKNTFLEIADQKQIFERDDIWRRYASEPIKVATTGSGFPGDGMTEFIPETMPITEMPQMEVVAENGDGSNSVLLLSESIPSQRAPPQERERRDRRENQAQIIKDVAVTQQKPPWKDVTTVMMRNLPNKYTQQMLLEELQEVGFTLQQDFDFFYLPMDHHNAANLGYCFINFVAPYLANEFSTAFEGKKMKRFNSSKTVVVMPASIQGYEKNYAYYSSTRVVQAEDPQYRPLFLRQLPPGQAAAYTHSGGKRGKGCSPSNSSTGKGGGSPTSGGGAKGKDKAANHAGKGQKGGKDSAGKAGKGKAGQGSDYAMPSRNQPQQSRGSSLPMPDMFSQAPYNEMDASTYVNPLAAPSGDMRRPSHQSAAPPSPQQSTTFFCPWCGFSVQSVYQFCPQCGSNLDLSRVGDGSNMDLGAAALRADAPAFVPPVPSAAPRLPMPFGSAPAQALQGSPTAQNDPARFKDSVTDELDVMRGRMMLLAVLKDMEKREGEANGGCPQV